jgi:hypothetical protein
MNYTKSLPEVEDLRRLSGSLNDFPISVHRTVAVAIASGYKNEVIDFLKLFQGSFESRADFYARTTELVMLIKEEKRQPEETVLSSQD